MLKEKGGFDAFFDALYQTRHLLIMDPQKSIEDNQLVIFDMTNISQVGRWHVVTNSLMLYLASQHQFVWKVFTLHLSCCSRSWICFAESVDQDQPAHTCSLILLCTHYYQLFISVNEIMKLTGEIVNKLT